MSSVVTFPDTFPLHVASVGVDFVSGQSIGFLFPGETESCINIALINDETALEGNEVFRVDLSIFLPVPIDRSTAEVIIIDNDCKPIIL